MAEKKTDLPSPSKAVNKLEPREKIAAYGGAFLSAAVFVVLTVPYLGKHPAKGQLPAIDYLLIGLGISALLAVATLLSRRALVGFTALFIGFALTGISFLLSLPFLALAGWLILRAFRLGKEAQTARQTALEERKGMSEKVRDRSRSSERRGRSSPGSTPAPSKRYTPPKPISRSKKIRQMSQDAKNNRDNKGHAPGE
ncbi:MAG: hypothetical protein M1483_01840 [Actinobacteria bacterium]|jgi:hypothetical protein|nr:hypothetical protein [Actinomycetota bacterium]MCL6104372.1 hypothetical protein [Actinomycetota bacterium]